MLELVAEVGPLRVYDKPAGLSLLADRSGADNLWNQLKQGTEKPYLVHRLDKGTSGTLLIATTQDAQRALTRAFADRRVDKFYLAWVSGEFPGGASLTLDLPMCRGRKSRYRLAGPRDAIIRKGHTYRLVADREGVDAQTRVRRLAYVDNRSLLLVKPLTGRTHQIRVHLSWLGYPLLGEHLYGKPADPAQQASRLMLHCHCLHVPGWGVFRTPAPATFVGSETS